jgi:aminoglycoside/choline kinase family phosphotransferase
MDSYKRTKDKMTHSKNPDARLRELIAAFLKDIGLATKKVRFHSLPSDGSKRLFWRIFPSKTGTSFIVMENVPADDFARRENLAYLMIGKHLFQKGLPIPEIHRFDLGNGWFILQDMGDRSLQEAAKLQQNRIPIYEKVIELLFRVQTEGSGDFKTEWCCQTEKYDRSVMRHYESDYFRDSFLCNYLGLKKDWPELEEPFNHLAEIASRADSHFFLHRDFQSRNILLSNDKIGILDWQGGRLGPLPYDLASILIDPYTELSAQERDQLYQYYLVLLGGYQSKLVDPFKKYFPYLAIQRNLQILGAFSYLSKVQRKSFFEHYISPALKSLHGLLDERKDPRLSVLTDVLNALPPLG